MRLADHFWRSKLATNVKLLVIALCLCVQQVNAQDLLQTYQQVVKSDPRLLIDTLGVEVGVARKNQSFGALLPQASLNSNLASNTRRMEGRSIDHYSGERYSFSVQQTLFDMPKFRAWQKSGAVLEQFQFQLKETQSAVRLDTIERYFALLQANDELALVEEAIVAVSKQKDQVEALYNKQLVKITDFYEIEARLDMLGSQEVDASQKVALAKGGLSELTQEPVTKIVRLSKQIEFGEQAVNVDQAVESLASKSPKLKALGKSVEAARMHLKQQKERHYPVLGIQLSKQKSDIGFDNTLSPVTDTEIAALTISIPLFSGGATSARVYEARQQLAISRATFDQELRKSTKELKDEFLQVGALERRIQATGKAMRSTQKSYQAIDKSFKFMVATISDVLDAQQAYLKSKREFQQTIYDYILSRARLKHKTGDLNDESVAKINTWLNEKG
ncbi:MAG: outer membrane protein [Colwellia sp.]|jgi:outer membrane protein